MKHLIEYINESLLLLEAEESGGEVNEPKDAEDTETLREFASKLFDALRKKGSLKDYVKLLRGVIDGSTVEDKDNTIHYLHAIAKIFNGQQDASDDGFNKYECKGEEDIPVTELFPTQSEIDIENSAKWATKDWGAKGVEDMFNGKGFGESFPVPVLVYNDGKKNWIIDGHHRWSQVALINPKAKLHCMTITGKQSAQEFLKLVQSVIAAVIAKRNDFKPAQKEEDNIPIGKAKPNNNIFGDALAGDKLKEKILSMFKQNAKIFEILYKTLIKVKLIDKNGKIIAEGIANRNEVMNSIAEYVMKNRDKMIERGQAPEKWAEPRPVMPQSDRAGATGSKDSGADKKGSALNMLKNVKALPDV